MNERGVAPPFNADYCRRAPGPGGARATARGGAPDPRKPTTGGGQGARATQRARGSDGGGRNQNSRKDRRRRKEERAKTEKAAAEGSRQAKQEQPQERASPFNLAFRYGSFAAIVQLSWGTVLVVGSAALGSVSR